MGFLTSVNIKETMVRFGYSPETLTTGSTKRCVFRCQFCFSLFESCPKDVRRSKNVACGNCRSISAAYTTSGAVGDKHEFYLDRRPVCHPVIDVSATVGRFGYSPHDLGKRSKKRVVARCEFCLSKFETAMCVVLNKPAVACKACDAVASSYARSGGGDKHEFYLSKRPDVPFDAMDVDATRAQFGYDPKSLATFSAKKIVAVCKHCGSHVQIRMSKYSLRDGNVTCGKTVCVRKKTVQTLQERYGVTCTLDIPSVQEKLANPTTEQMIATMLSTRYGVEFVRNHVIGPYSFDFFIPSSNLLIECQGDFFHDFKNNGYSGTSQDRAKSTYVERHTGHKLVWVWEHELHVGRLSKILDFHIRGVSEPELTFDLSELQFGEVSKHVAHTFLSQFHYLGNLGSVATPMGASLGDEAIAVCAFGGVTRNQSIAKINKFTGKSFGPKDVRELRRFCLRPNVNVENLASFCLSRMVREYGKASGVKALLSFSDTSVGDLGTIYKATNWVSMGETGKSYHYLDPKTGKSVHKKTVWDSAKSAHILEHEFAVKAGLVKVDEEPKGVWLKLV